MQRNTLAQAGLNLSEAQTQEFLALRALIGCKAEERTQRQERWEQAIHNLRSAYNGVIDALSPLIAPSTGTLRLTFTQGSYGRRPRIKYAWPNGWYVVIGVEDPRSVAQDGHDRLRFYVTTYAASHGTGSIRNKLDDLPRILRDWDDRTPHGSPPDPALAPDWD